MTSVAERVLLDRMNVEVPYSGDAFDECVQRAWLFRHGPGVFSFFGKLLEFRQAFDARILELAVSMKCAEIEPPVLYRMADAEKAGFFAATPQYAQFVSSGGETLGPDSLCRSAICQPIYPSFHGKRLPTQGLVSLTAVGKAFRGENDSYSTLERLREFCMRELVFLGEAGLVQAALSQCHQWIEARMDEFGLKGQIRTASDPFFGEHSETLRFYQLSHESKIEWSLWLPKAQKGVAVASINNHGAHFGKKFDIHFKDGDLPIHSGCVGFGEDRFIFAVLSQYGLDEAQWPKALRTFLSR